MEKPKIAVSFSGGRTSAYMSYMIKKHWSDSHDLVFAFANTGKENEQTLEFAHKCDIEFRLGLHWVEAVVTNEKGVGTTFKRVDFASANRTGEPFEAEIQKWGIPNVATPKCSDQLKAQPLKKLFQQEFGTNKFHTAIGIRMDEFDRMSADRKKLRIIYPLISEWPTRKTDVDAFFSKMPFDLKLKAYQGNCDLCYKKSLAKRLKIAKESPEKLDWWQEMENKYGHIRSGQGTKVFGRNHQSIAALRKLALMELSRPQIIQMGLFDDVGACGAESCEAF